MVWPLLSSAVTALWGGEVTVTSLGGCSRSTHHTWDHQGMKADFGFSNSQSPRQALGLTFPGQCLFSIFTRTEASHVIWIERNPVGTDVLLTPAFPVSENQFRACSLGMCLHHSPCQQGEAWLIPRARIRGMVRQAGTSPTAPWHLKGEPGQLGTATGISCSPGTTKHRDKPGLRSRQKIHQPQKHRISGVQGQAWAHCQHS